MFRRDGRRLADSVSSAASRGLGAPRGARPWALSLSYAARVGTLAAIYFAAAKLGLSLAGTHPSVSLVWPPTGIALAALLVGYRLWPGVALGAFLANASTEVSLATAAGIATGNTLEAVAGAFLLQRVVRFRPSLERLQDVLGLVVLAAGLSTTVSATVGVTSLGLGGVASWAAYGSLWWQWWLGDAMGALVVAPVLLTWGAAAPLGWPGRQGIEAVGLLVALGTVSQVVFGGWFTTESATYPLAFIVFPFVIWAALRLGPRGAAAATLVVSTIAIWGTARHVGPFLGPTLTESLLVFQMFVSAVAMTGLVLGAVITQRRRAEEALQQSERRYRELVENATDLVYTLDLAGNFTSLNTAGEQLTGYTREEALTLNFVEAVVAPAHRERAWQMIARQVAEATPSVSELEIVAKDGRRVPVEVSTRLVSQDGKPIGVQGIARDITERKQAAAALESANEDLSRWANELEERTRQITLLSDMGELLQSCFTAEEAYTVIAQFGQKIFPGDSGALGIFRVSKNLVEVVAVWGQLAPGERIFAPDQCWALRRGRVHFVEGPGSGLFCRHVDPSASARYLCVPMMAQGEPVGVLHLQGGRSRSSRPDPSLDDARESHQRLAVTVAEHIALALANLRLQETLRSQAIRDPLTGLFNRRYMEESLEREVRRAGRSGTPLGIIMIDIDHFKGFNDTFGHEAGDTLLGALGNFLRAHIRAEDIACRYGGEEFTLIMPVASLDATRERAEQIREGVKHLHVPHRGGVLGPVTLSLGVATFPEHGASGRDVLLAADAALYRAKHEGRDRLVVAQ